MKRYAVECDTPDRGRSTYPECFGRGGKRGRVLSEHETIEDAVIACDGDPATSTSSVDPWIWDRLKGCIVSAKRITAVKSDK